MMFRLPHLACAAVGFAVCAVPLTGQGVVPPTRLGATHPLAGLNAPVVPATAVQQVQLTRLLVDPPGTYTASLTVSGLDRAWGGQGGSDLLIGRYDAVNDTFTPSLTAAACNTQGNEFGAMLDSKGLLMVFERDGQVYRATRSSVQAGFDNGSQVGNLPASAYYDPAFGAVGGLPMLFYANEGSILRASYDQHTNSLLGPRVVVVSPTRPGAEANSPTPIVDRLGEVTGLLHHESLGTDNDQYLTTDLDPRTPSQLVVDTPTWLNNGGAAGGLLVSAENSPAPYHIVATETVWMSGGESPIGRALQVRFNVPPSPGDPSYSWLALALDHAPAPIPIQGVRGSFGLDPATTFTVLDVGQHVAMTGEASYTTVIPNDPALLGVEIASQGLTQTRGALHFTNTSSIRVATYNPARNMAIRYDGIPVVLVPSVDPNDPAMTITLSSQAPAPIEIVALDPLGMPMNEPVQVYPGSVASLIESTASRYVAYVPSLTGATAVLAIQIGFCAATVTRHGPYCVDRQTRWTLVELPKAGTLCIELQPQTNGNNTDCNPVVWEMQSMVNGAWLTDKNGSVDSRTDIGETVCLTERAGSTKRQLRFRCDGDTRNRCRLTISVTVVKDCDACKQGKQPRRP
ncbi:MAG: hypothetical protein IPM29_22200 [Planctomycetes bacterium]|nr:hypothetical protein [Planctomycetota bacterium]